MMRTINVAASNGAYDVLVDDTLDVGGEIRQRLGVTGALVISDDTVFALHGQSLTGSLSASGITTHTHIIPHGERHKTLNTVSGCLDALAEKQLPKDTLLIALGGGVVGDITGFCAAIYLRGIRYVQVPTTLLATVDSSVGGKTGVDLPHGKNLVGAFWQPSLVLCQTRLLSTLPRDVCNDGMAEVIKYGVIRDADLLNTLDGDKSPQCSSPHGDKSPQCSSPHGDIGDVVARCIAIKAAVVQHDPFDRGERRLLNFGHTVGHAIEKVSDYAISHGSAVAMGMAIVCRAADSLGWTHTPCADTVCGILARYNLPTTCNYSAEALANAALSDKKRVADTVALIVPRRVGECVVRDTPVSELAAFIERGLV